MNPSATQRKRSDLGSVISLKRAVIACFNCDTRGMTEAESIKNVSDAAILLLSNRPLSRVVIEACPKLKLICVAFTVIDHVDPRDC